MVIDLQPFLKQRSNPPDINFVSQGQGPPAVLVHGLAASLHDWDMLIPELAAQGYTCYAADLLGHGESAKPRKVDQYTIDSTFAHLHKWINTLSLEEPAVLIGHSLGGYLSLQYALRFPERVRALILVNPFFSLRQLPSAFSFFLRRPLFNIPIIERTPYWLFRLITDVTSLQFGSTHENLHSLPQEVRMQTAMDYKRASAGIYNIPRTLRNISSRMHMITQPALVIWGARDQTIDPSTFPSLVEQLPNARHAVMPVCGHVPHQCHTHEFNQKVFEFLKSL